MNWHDDTELFEMMRRKLFTAVVGDVLDAQGHLHQFLPSEIQPLREDMIVVGRAMTVLEADLDQPPGAGDKPFGLLFESLDDLKPRDVYLITGGSPTYSLWGELMSTRAMKLGAAGCVSNGPTRDTKGILELNFPTFSTGRYAQDQRPRGEVVDFRVPIAIGQVRIAPGDIVFGDVDGVVIIPRDIEQDVLAAALEKVEAENKVRTAIESGVSATEAFRRYGVM
jgi:regulator of RNase E activity RraA